MGKNETRITERKNERGDSLPFVIPFKRMIREYCEQQCANLNEMDKFLEGHRLLKLTQEEIENLNKPLTSTGLELVFLKLHTMKNPSIQRKMNTNLSQTSQNRRGRKYFPTLPISPALSRHQNLIKASQEKYRLISLLNIDTKIHNKIQANQIQQHVKKNYVP